MAKTFKQYAAERATTASADEAAAVQVFDSAYATYGVGAALAVARKARRLNQTELAALAGIDQGDVSRIERGLISPTMSTLMRMVEALDGRLMLNLPAQASDEPSLTEGELVLALSSAH